MSCICSRQRRQKPLVREGNSFSSNTPGKAIWSQPQQSNPPGRTCKLFSLSIVFLFDLVRNMILLDVCRFTCEVSAISPTHRSFNRFVFRPRDEDVPLTASNLDSSCRGSCSRGSLLWPLRLKAWDLSCCKGSCSCPVDVLQGCLVLSFSLLPLAEWKPPFVRGLGF